MSKLSEKASSSLSSLSLSLPPKNSPALNNRDTPPDDHLFDRLIADTIIIHSLTVSVMGSMLIA